MKVTSRAVASIFYGYLLLATILFGVPAEGIVWYIQERNVVDVLYQASKDGNVVDRVFEKVVQPHVDTAYANGATDAMVVFDTLEGTSTMQYRIWDGTTWGSESTTNTFLGTDILWAQLKYAPNRDEAILVALTNTGQVQAQVFNGSSWGSATTLATLNDANGSPNGGALYRGFDVEYEQSSGDAIVVSGDGTADPNYHIWNGSTWSLNNNIDIPTTGRPYWIELAAPLSTTSNDSLALITLDSNSDVYGMRWTGSAWDNMGVTTTWDAAATVATRKTIDVAFETNTGDIMFLWGDSVAADDHNYRAYSGGSLGAVTALANANAGGQPYWIRLASNPNTSSNQIMLGSLDSAADLNTYIWSGTAWSAVHAEHSAAVENAAAEQDFEIVFETHTSNTDDAWLLWNNGTAVSRKLWNGPTSAWGTATTMGDDNAAIVLNAHPNNGAVLTTVYEDDTSATDDIREAHLTSGSQTWSGIATFWDGPVKRNLGVIRMAQAVQSYNASTEGMVAYVTENSLSYPQYKRWTGSSWGSVASASPTSGEIRHMVLKTAPTRDEAMLVTLGSTGKVEAQVWDGTSEVWGSATLLSTMNNANGDRDLQSLYRGFDIEYESGSGDAIVVSGDGTADPNYHVWNGSTWSLNNNIDIPTTGRPNWIELAAPLATTTNDALAMIVLDSNVDIYGMRWTGSAWDNMGTAAVWDATGAIATEKSIDVAFETGSGDIMFIWGDATSTDQYYRTYSGTTLSAATLLDHAQAGAVNNWMTLASNPTAGANVDQIMYGVLDGGSDLNTYIWSGTAWSAVHTEHSAAAETHASHAFNIAFETYPSNADDAWLVYGDGNTISRKLWNGTTQTWGTATTQGDDTDFLLLNAHPNSGAFFMAAYESSASASDDITENRLTGGSQTWGTASSLWTGPVARTALPLSKIAIASERYLLPTFSQAAYRFFANTNTTDVGTTLAAQDTGATLSSAGDAFRLRMLLRVDTSNLATNGKDFKLQFAEKSGTCDTGFSGETYADITGATVIAYNNNASPADGDNLIANANDPTDSGRTIVNQDYEEANNFTNTAGAIPSGQDGKWDFALIDNGAPANTSYCIRAVQSNGTQLDTYTVIPEVTTAAGGGSGTLTFSISHSAVGFGTLNKNAVRYATNDLAGSGSESIGHTITASTNAASGYVITMRGATLTSGSNTITAIGGTSAASNPGTEQYGLRITASGGTNATVSAPYNHASNYAYAADAATSDEIAADTDGDDTPTTYSLRYLGNISGTTEAGSYATTLTYIITAGF